MKKLINYLKHNKSGQGVMEYIIISSLVGILCLGMFHQFGDVLKKRVEVMKKKITEHLPTDI